MGGGLPEAGSSAQTPASPQPPITATLPDPTAAATTLEHQPAPQEQQQSESLLPRAGEVHDTVDPPATDASNVSADHVCNAAGGSAGSAEPGNMDVDDAEDAQKPLAAAPGADPASAAFGEMWGGWTKVNAPRISHFVRLDEVEDEEDGEGGVEDDSTPKVN